jgi:hypothetical protein
MSLGRIQLQGSVLPSLIDSIKLQVNLQKLDVGIPLLENTYLMGDLIPLCVEFVLLLGLHSSFSIVFLVYVALLHAFRYQGIGFGFSLVAG